MRLVDDETDNDDNNNNAQLIWMCVPNKKVLLHDCKRHTACGMQVKISNSSFVWRVLPGPVCQTGSGQEHGVPSLTGPREEGVPPDNFKSVHQKTTFRSQTITLNPVANLHRKKFEHPPPPMQTKISSCIRSRGCWIHGCEDNNSAEMTVTRVNYTSIIHVENCSEQLKAAYFFHH